jgi:hypothetical protein
MSYFVAVDPVTLRPGHVRLWAAAFATREAALAAAPGWAGHQPWVVVEAPDRPTARLLLERTGEDAGQQ